MPNIRMIRIDERLIHGQIIIKWIEVKKADAIVIIDDEIASDPIIKGIFRMTLPQFIGLAIYGLEEGIKFLITNNSKENVILLVKDLWIVKEIYEKGVKMDEIIIGRIPSGVGKKKVYSNVFLSDEDIEIIKFFKNEGVFITIQVVPDSEPVNIYDVVC